MAVTLNAKDEHANQLRETFTTVILNLILTFVTLSTDMIDHWWDPVKQGFYCEDESLSQPLYPNTVPSKYLFIFALGVCPLVVIIMELICNKKPLSSKPLTIFKILTDGFFGFVCVCLVTQMTKFVVGRPR